VPAARRGTPWYKHRDVLGLVAILVLVGIGVIVWLVGSARDEARELRDDQAILDQYTSQIRGALQPLNEPVGEMSALSAPPTGDAVDELADQAERWSASIQAAQTQVTQIFAVDDVAPVNEIMSEAVALYASAAQTFALVPTLEGQAQEEVFARAVQQRDSATALLESAIGVLDVLRKDKEMRASGLRAPGPQPGAQPATLPSPVVTTGATGGSTSVEVGGDGDKGANGGNGGKKSGGKGRNDNN